MKIVGTSLDDFHTTGSPARRQKLARAYVEAINSENDGAWDGTAAATGQPVNFATADFLRVDDGVAAERWDSVDYVRLYQAFGLLPYDI